jgi:type IV pilus assembly protein PilC
MTPAEKQPETPKPQTEASRRGVQRLLPESEGEKKSLSSVLNRNLSIGGPGLAQMTAFCRQLATLIDVGIPLLQSLTILSQRVEHPQLKRIVADVARRVEEGGSFSDGLAAHPEVFSSLVINVVRIGEAAGILQGSLTYLADLMERRQELRGKVQSALAYPIAALIVCALMIVVVLNFAIPVFAKFYRDAGAWDKLPKITKIVIGASDFVKGFWWLIIVVVLGAIFALRFLIKTFPGWRRAWDGFCLQAPIIRPLTVKVNVARTTRTLGSLLHAGIPLLEALRITAETSENVLVAEMLQATHDNLEAGGRFEKPMRDAAIFPPLVLDMIAIGDETGRLDLMFDKVAHAYDADVNQSLATLNAIIEPAFIIVMGGIVLVLALAVLLPYWKISNVVNSTGGGS